MVDPVTAQRLVWRSLLAALAALILLVQVLPVTVEAGRWPGPDLVLALVFAWGFRRPDFVPPWLLAAVCLMADLLLQRPPGLWAALVVLAMEVLRTRYALWRDLPFPGEWLVVSVMMAAVTVLYWLVLALFMVDQAAIGLHLIELIATVLAYPLVVGASAVLGLRKAAPGELEAQGHRI